MRFAEGGRALERLAGGGGRRLASPPRRWRALRAGSDPWEVGTEVPDQAWLRRPGPSLAREVAQQALLFPLTRWVTHPRVIGADDLMHVPQPAVIAPNHGSDLDTPLILAALPRAWRARTVIGAASDRFYRNRILAVATGFWINTFPFDRSGELRGLADAAELLRDGHNVLLYPQGTRLAGTTEGFRTGVARLCIATDVPLVPVYVAGTALLMPKDRGLTQRGRTTVVFGPPLAAAPGEDPRSFMERAAAAIEALASRARRGR
jgi:1-acyl-sn-glycerol-3-phosphate acyltransferase